MNTIVESMKIWFFLGLFLYSFISEASEVTKVEAVTEDVFAGLEVPKAGVNGRCKDAYDCPGAQICKEFYSFCYGGEVLGYCAEKFPKEGK